MIITGYPFLLVFLPAAYLLYWRVARTQRHRLIMLCLVNVGFYYWAASYFTILLVLMSLVTYLLASKKWIRTGILLNLLPLLAYKAIVSGDLTGGALTVQSAALVPLGISYFTFKHIGYLIDVGQERIPAADNWLRFLAYSSFFAQIVAGPISSYDDTAPQIAEQQPSLPGEKAYLALAYIAFGLAKKVLISDPIGGYLNGEIAHLQMSSLFWSWGILVLFAIEIYFNFSGYTDLALGIGLLFGVRLPENFENPFMAATPRDFWNRWHMSMSSWFRHYVYFPLSRALLRRFGGRHTETIEYATTLITMALIGLWHSFSPGFLLWGLYNGLLLALQAWGARRRVAVTPPIARRMFFLFGILLGFSLLLYPDANATLRFIVGLLGANGWGALHLDDSALLAATTALALVVGGLTECAGIQWSKKPRHALALGILAALCILFLGNELRAFTYAQF